MITTKRLKWKLQVVFIISLEGNEEEMRIHEFGIPVGFTHQANGLPLSAEPQQ